MEDPTEETNVTAEIVVEEPNLSPAQEATLQVGVTHDAENSMLQVVNLNADNVLHEPTCLICSSPYRQ